MKSMKTLFALPVILLLVACSGGSNSAPTTVQVSGMTYTDPVPDTGEWALLKDPQASTKTRLVLNLVGPTGSLYRGVGFNLKADASKVAFSRFKDANGVSLGYMLDKGVLHDLDESSQSVSCLASAAGVKADILTVGLFQKCMRFTINPSNTVQPQGSRNINDAMDCSTAPVLQVALDLGKDVTPGAVPLVVTKAAIIPNHGTNMEMPLKATVRVGTLTLQ